MAITVTLSPEIEAKLCKQAAIQGKDIVVLATELLANAIEWETKDCEEAVAGIQSGLEAFEAGEFRSFDKFADEQRRKHNLLTNL
ncbi:hypothetical protein [Scytonema sp. NUACC26]|uniref:hypothetical protein n=1 Tax=Scytonema sp. NUACC26 TaxID=3140176 RepID=UPI0034DBF3FE